MTPARPAPCSRPYARAAAARARAAARAAARPSPSAAARAAAPIPEALASGDASRALRALDDHDRRFAAGALGPEVLVLRIQALVLRGDRAAAARLGNAYLDAHPRSPHANRVRSLLGVAEPSP
jgi:hypothetical protein